MIHKILIMKIRLKYHWNQIMNVTEIHHVKKVKVVAMETKIAQVTWSVAREID